MSLKYETICPNLNPKPQVGCVLKVEPNPSGLATCQTEAGPSEGPACDEADEVPPEPLPSEEGTT